MVCCYEYLRVSLEQSTNLNLETAMLAFNDSGLIPDKELLIKWQLILPKAVWNLNILNCNALTKASTFNVYVIIEGIINKKLQIQNLLIFPMNLFTSANAIWYTLLIKLTRTTKANHITAFDKIFKNCACTAPSIKHWVMWIHYHRAIRLFAAAGQVSKYLSEHSS